MKILVRHLPTGHYFDGRSFAPRRETARDFKNARTALRMIRERKWFGMAIVLAYLERKMDYEVSTESMTLRPDLTERVRLRELISW